MNDNAGIRHLLSVVLPQLCVRTNDEMNEILPSSVADFVVCADLGASGMITCNIHEKLFCTE
jgi:hypothetical protein